MTEVTFKKGDRVKVLFPDYGLFGTTGVLESFQGQRPRVKLDKVPRDWGSSHCVVGLDEVEVLANHDGFRQKLFDYLLTKNNNEHKNAQKRVAEFGWGHTEAELFDFVKKLLADNPSNWCKQGVDRARTNLGIPTPVQKVKFTVDIEVSDTGKLDQIRQQFINKFESTSGVERVSNVVYTADSTRK